MYAFAGVQMTTNLVGIPIMKFSFKKLLDRLVYGDAVNQYNLLELEPQVYDFL